ncbi:MAG: Hpt domain-containing protein [Bacteroidales bacterium]|nr:Hpt domain-containing protein [Bacteroidales bacterium]
MKVIDKSSFLDTFQYFDKEIVVEIIDIFLQEYPGRLVNIKKDIESGDFDALKFDAHSLKGVVSNFVAKAPQDYAKELEMKGTIKDSTDLLDTFQKLEISIYDLVDDLNELRSAFVI